jgi:hypothetical protein
MANGTASTTYQMPRRPTRDRFENAWIELAHIHAVDADLSEGDRPHQGDDPLAVREQPGDVLGNERHRLVTAMTATPPIMW